VTLRSTVLASFETADGTQCVDFRREDGTFGFEQYRSEFDGPGEWQSLGKYSQLSFVSGEDALRLAQQRVPWLSTTEVWRW